MNGKKQALKIKYQNPKQEKFCQADQKELQMRHNVKCKNSYGLKGAQHVKTWIVLGAELNSIFFFSDIRRGLRTFRLYSMRLIS